MAICSKKYKIQHPLQKKPGRGYIDTKNVSDFFQRHNESTLLCWKGKNTCYIKNEQ